MPGLEPFTIEPMSKTDTPVFRTFVEKHKRRVYFLALDLTGNHHDAEDLSQDVFIKAHRALDSFRGEAQVETWLYRIAVNAFLNRRRKKALSFMRLRDDLGDSTFQQQVMPPPEEGVSSEVIQKHILLALDKLSARERSAFILRFYHDLSVKEVAGLLRVADGTVKSLLYRAVQKMRKYLIHFKADLGIE